MDKLARLDHRYVWHPFTQMRDWLEREPILITSGKGSVLGDSSGRHYLDANSSIWTNLHGHNHPRINRAIKRQLAKIAHSSTLGLANEPASLLAQCLVQSAGSPHPPHSRPQPAVLNKVLFSDDGSTAIEVALKLAYEYARRTEHKIHPRFLSLEGAYHGDTVGAVSMGHIDLFHKSYSGLLFKTDKVPAPYCYRCRFNRAEPARADARRYKICNWECLDALERKLARQKRTGNPYAAFAFEPLIQGAAGMIPQPPGWLSGAAKLARSYGALLIADEVLTGFGRTGIPDTHARRHGVSPPLFGCQHEGVSPDFLAVAKGLTGGYLPMAATLTTQAVFDTFLGEYHEFKTFFHGHSYTGNQLGAAAALASLDLLAGRPCVSARQRLEHTLESELWTLWDVPFVGDIRRVGLIAGVEIVKDWRTREQFDLRQRVGARVCEAMSRRGVLTRPIGDVIVIMPPYCTSPGQVRQIVRSLAESVMECLNAKEQALGPSGCGW